MDYPYAKFGDFSFSSFGFIMPDRENHRQMQMIDLLTRLPSVWPVDTVVWQQPDNALL